MIGPGLAGASFTGYATGFYAGLVGVLTVSIETEDGDVVLAPTTDDIAEIDAGGTFSVYRYAGTFPPELGNYVVIWTDGDGVQASEELVVASQVTADTADVPTAGPCEVWATGEDVAVCCAAVPGTDTALLDASAEAASEVLFLLSGKRFTGVCSRTVRPCSSGPRCGHVWSRYDDRGPSCGCGRLSEVLLPSAPVLQVTQVLVDGEVVPPSTYRIDSRQRLVRVRDPEDVNTPLYWPSCQALDRDSDQVGTFEVSYLSGIAPPQLGVDAAAELACEIYRGCDAANEDCRLPVGATKVTRQGVTIELARFTAWAFSEGRWATGMALVDLFLTTYNPTGARRPPAVWSPDGPQHARTVGQLGAT